MHVLTSTVLSQAPICTRGETVLFPRHRVEAGLQLGFLKYRDYNIQPEYTNWG